MTCLQHVQVSAVGVSYQYIYITLHAYVISVLHYALASAVGVLFQCIPYACAVGVSF